MSGVKNLVQAQTDGIAVVTNADLKEAAVATAEPKAQ